MKGKNVSELIRGPGRKVTSFRHQRGPMLVRAARRVNRTRVAPLAPAGGGVTQKRPKSWYGGLVAQGCCERVP